MFVFGADDLSVSDAVRRREQLRCCLDTLPYRQQRVAARTSPIAQEQTLSRRLDNVGPRREIFHPNALVDFVLEGRCSEPLSHYPGASGTLVQSDSSMPRWR